MSTPQVVRQTPQERAAEKERQREKQNELRLFVGCIPNFVTKENLRGLVSAFGALEDFHYTPDQAKGDRGLAFIKFTTPEAATSLLENWAGSLELFPNQVRPMQVKRHAETLRAPEGTVFEKIEYSKPVTAWEEHETMEGYRYYYHALTKETVWDKPAELDYNNGGSQCFDSMMIPQNPVQQTTSQAYMVNATCGPPGCNLFVFHIPNSWNDDLLRQVFSPFGRVVAGRVQMDSVTGAHKGYGFISYDNPKSTVEAIKHMQGFDTHAGKHLQVSIKKGEEEYNPEAVNLVSAQKQARSNPLANILSASGLDTSQLMLATQSVPQLSGGPQLPQLSLEHMFRNE